MNDNKGLISALAKAQKGISLTTDEVLLIIQEWQPGDPRSLVIFGPKKYAGADCKMQILQRTRVEIQEIDQNDQEELDRVCQSFSRLLQEFKVYTHFHNLIADQKEVSYS